MREEVIDSIVRLDHWVDRNGWAGYDPFDVRGHPWIVRLLSIQNRNLVIRGARFALLKATIDMSPLFWRKFLKVEQQVNPKAMALFASGYLDLYQRLKEDTYLHKASECLEWLEQNKSQGYAGAGWGLPFDWQALVLISRWTPVASVTAICGDAFWDFYKLTGDKKYLDTCQSICEFFLRDLNLDNADSGELCFSYVPVAKFHVHNGNLFVAEFLIRVGKELNHAEFYQQGIKALNYTLNAQNEDGSFYYWSPDVKEAYNIPDSILRTVDHYHTGFVLRSLYSIYKNTNQKKVLNTLTKGYEFYKENLFEGGAIPRLYPHSEYPINIHGCAEAILCMSTLSDLFPEALDYAQRAFQWTRNNMQDKDGHFYYLRTRFRLDKTPYIRWGQAWMLRALSKLLIAGVGS